MQNENQEISLSVIVCCNNVEHYLDKSLKCLERQWGDRTDYEILLVNDGSADGTLAKLNDFQSRHPDNVKVIDKKQNAGLAAARNSALDIARGKWIGFFDPDDLLAEGSYVKLLELIEAGADYDMLRFGVQIVEGDTDIPAPVLTEPLSIDWRGTSLEYMQESSFGTCWCYLYRREVIGDRRFPTNMIIEDLLFLVPVLLEGQKMAKTKAKVYYYFVRSDAATSVSHNRNRLGRQSEDIASGVAKLEEFKQGQPENIQQRLLEKQQLLVHNMSVRMLLSDKGPQEVDRIVQSMRKLKLFPLAGGGMMVGLINYVFSHLWALSIFRPMYRSFRSLYPKIRRLLRR